jgi:ubiquinone/menaquinone biosynthesis C-methylase UbiE
MIKKLNLGCGKDIKKDYVNLDSIKLPGVDIVHNLEVYPWPFKKNDFDYVYCHHVLEHMESIIKPMEEIWRITKNGARVFIEVPNFPSIGCAADPTHKQFYTYLTFNYFRPEDNLNYYTHARFKIIKRKIIFSKLFPFLTWFFNLSEKMQKFHTLFLSNILPAEILQAELETIK